MTFDDLWKRLRWEAIGGCPGRFVLRDRTVGAPAELLGGAARVHRFEVAAAGDPVLIAAISGGGLICYARADGSYVHTLNTPDGFRRKLDQLGIVLPAEIFLPGK